MNQAALLLIAASLIFASLVVWIILLLRRLAGQPILAAEPRRDVPWRWLDVVLVIGPLVGLALAAQLAKLLRLASNARDVDLQNLGAAEQWIPLLLADVVVKLTLIGFAVVLGVVRGRASASDFGVTSRGIGRDLKLGAIAFLATLLPVYSVQFFMIQVSPPDRQHPVLQLIGEKSDAAALLLAAFVAVVYAPLVEEFLFRAFLQGWLEAALRPAPQPSPPPVPSLPLAEFGSPPVLESDAVENPYTPPGVDPTRAAGFIPVVGELPSDGQAVENRIAAPVHAPARPAWTAIVISSIVFAALHAPEWPAPVPLLFLAMILGYLYNRTHRLLPCIVVHLLFNGLSVAVVLSGVGPK